MRSIVFKMVFSVWSLACIGLWASEKGGEPEGAKFEITGEVPEGWEVVELSDAPLIEKWVELKSGEKKKVLLRPFGLKPIRSDESKFTVSNPLETSAGDNLSEVVEAQNENLVQSQEELSSMLTRLKQLLLTLPNPIEPEQKKS